MSTTSSQSRIVLLAAWLCVLLTSAVPEILLSASYPLPLSHWITLSKAGLLVGVLLATAVIQALHPLRPLLAMLLVMHLATSGIGSFAASSTWIQLANGVHDPFLHVMLNVQFVRVAVTVVILIALFAIFRDSSSFFLASEILGPPRHALPGLESQEHVAGTELAPCSRSFSAWVRSRS